MELGDGWRQGAGPTGRRGGPSRILRRTSASIILQGASPPLCIYNFTVLARRRLRLLHSSSRLLPSSPVAVVFRRRRRRRRRRHRRRRRRRRLRSDTFWCSCILSRLSSRPRYDVARLANVAGPTFLKRSPSLSCSSFVRLRSPLQRLSTSHSLFTSSQQRVSRRPYASRDSCQHFGGVLRESL